MFGFRRGRIPFALPILFIFILVALASVGSATSAMGAALLLPFFILKMFFMFFLFGAGTTFTVSLPLA